MYNKTIGITFLVMMMLCGSFVYSSSSLSSSEQIVVQFDTSVDCSKQSCDFNDPSMWIGGVVPDAAGYVASIDYTAPGSSLDGVQAISSTTFNLKLDSIIINSVVQSLVQLTLLNHVMLFDTMNVGAGCTILVLENSTLTIANNLSVADQGTVYVSQDSSVMVGTASFDIGSSYTQQVNGYFSSNGGASIWGELTLVGETSFALYGTGNVVGGLLTTGLHGIALFSDVLVTQLGYVDVQGSLVVTGTLELSRAASVVVNYNVSVVPGGSIVLGEYSTFKQSPSYAPAPAQGPVIVQIDNVIGQASSQISIGRADELNLGTLDLDGQLQITTLVDFTDIMGPANISQLILQATTSVNADLHFAIYTGHVNISQIYSYFTVGQPSTVSIVFDQSSLLVDTPITLYNTILTVSMQSVLNITTGFFSLSNDSQVIVNDGSSLNLYDTQFTTPNITTGTGSSVSITNTQMDGNILLNHGSSLLVNQSTITGDISADDAKLLFIGQNGSLSSVSGGLYVYSQATIGITVDSLSTSYGGVPLSAGSFELNDGTLSLNTLQPLNTLQVGQAYFIVQATESLIVIPTQCTIQFTLPANQSYKFSLIPNFGNGLKYLIFEIFQSSN
ncbi:hypothetical protein DFA_09243 [Cavenderia fasciculata]|uniref:Uncharacterized protein n=1 Tax=Cavenderia fasciculata TaxID=261658 RepID=F4Q731_CACFS|nr:uncharacterized protein DFA_09243 [Cavenderia fasciculata]EGG16213.1 hypothetical protein DFA_09243 [Cavenderia fasciculata]|eukprot:XP_004354597.1 hypothetical protein DFA_09243 [Cavenderia fasciculata]